MINKAKIDTYIQSYINGLSGRKWNDVILWDDCLASFQRHWNLDQLDLSTCFEYSFKSTISTRLWKRDNFYPIEVMAEFISYEKEIMRSLFRDLFDETKSVDGRIQRFVFYCDQLLNEIKEKGSDYPDHYHGDYFIPSLYLSFRYPDRYWFYDINLLRKVIKLLGDHNIPPSHDIERYYKVLNLLHNLLTREEGFSQWLSGFNESLKHRKVTKMWAYDLMLFIAKNE